MKKEGKKKKRPIIRALLSVAIGGVIGFFIGLNLLKPIMASGASLSVTEKMLLCLGLWLSIGFHIIIHEAGHWLFGSISGYEFVSFRILNLMFIRENGKLVRKKFNIVGTGGQCLMSPPEPANGQYPYVLYNLGGSMMNFLISGIILIPCLLLGDTALPYTAVAYLFVLMGLLTGFVNILPIKVSGIATDGYNALALRKNDHARHAFWLTLRTNALTTRGVRYRDMAAEWFDLPAEADYNDPIAVSHAILRFNYLMDCFQFDEAYTLAEHLLETADKMLEIHKNELRCELLFLEMIGACRKDKIDEMYTPALTKYIKATASYVSRQRLLYAYAKLVTIDEEKAAHLLQKFEKVSLSFPNLGEIRGERDMIAIIDQTAEKRHVSPDITP